MMDDDDTHVNGFGSLGGAGVEQHYKTQAKVVPGGVLFKISCDGCNRDIEIGVGWQELSIMAQGQMPGGGTWLYNQQGGCFMPNLACRVCRTPTRLGVLPDECNRHIKAGIAAGVIPKQ